MITGNPPYSGISKNNGAWISNLINTYKYVDGQHFGERKHWLNDDYVKFIRFAQWKMEQVADGVLGIIINHSFLDNPTFRGMRQSLTQTFNQIYVLDLHGSNKLDGKSPAGIKDENVFDIEQGVCISILMRNSKLERRLFHSELWGKRLDKYRFCIELKFSDIEWQELHPTSPFYFFVQRDESYREEYEAGWKVTAIFAEDVTGIVTARDGMVIDRDLKELKRRIAEFGDLAISDRQIIQKYRLKDTRGWKLTEARRKLAKVKDHAEFYRQIHYRPFDIRDIYYSRDMVDWGRDKFMRHMLTGTNIGLLSCRQTISDHWCHTFVSAVMIDDSLISNKTREGGYLFPLYIYNGHNADKTEPVLFSEDRKENLTAQFRSFLDAKYGEHYSAEQVAGYIYAILNCPSYRRRYAEFLKSDFPRIPFVDDRATFTKLSSLGWELIQAHLMRQSENVADADFPKRGDNVVGQPIYDPASHRLAINASQYFAPVPENVWSFRIGGYQVLDRYLRSRKGQALTLSEIENVLNIIKVLGFTTDQMRKIDAVWRPWTPTS